MVGQRAAFLCPLSLDLLPRIAIVTELRVASCETIEEDPALERIRRLVEQLRHRSARRLGELREAAPRLLADSDRGAHIQQSTGR